MNSPDPGSPISSDSSGSPQPDDFHLATNNRDSQRPLNAPATPLVSLINATQNQSGSSKRRLPMGSSHEGPSLRDAKSRRREDAASGSRRNIADGHGQQQAASAAGGSSGGGHFRGDYISRRDKEELVDMALVEQLRKGRWEVLFGVIVSHHGQNLETLY